MCPLNKKDTPGSEDRGWELGEAGWLAGWLAEVWRFGEVWMLGCLDVGMFGGSGVLPARSTSDGSADYYCYYFYYYPPTHRWSSVLDLILPNLQTSQHPNIQTSPSCQTSKLPTSELQTSELPTSEPPGSRPQSVCLFKGNHPV